MALTQRQKKIVATSKLVSTIVPQFSEAIEKSKDKLILKGRSADYYEGYGDALERIMEVIMKGGNGVVLEAGIATLASAAGLMLGELDEPAEGEQDKEGEWVPPELVT